MHRPFRLLAGIVLAVLMASPLNAQKTDDDMPPAGWKVYSPRDKTFAVWIPEKTKAPLAEKAETNVVDKKEKVKINVMFCETKTAFYHVQEFIFPPSVNAKTREILANQVRDTTVKALTGRVTSQSNVTVGSANGKDVRVESAAGVSRIRTFTSGSRLMVLRVTGKKAAVDGDEGSLFIESAKFTTKTGTTAGSVGATPKILGSPFGDPEFKELAPEGGLLIGLEVGLVKSGKSDWIKAVKPIFLVGDKEVIGETSGTRFDNTVTLKAKPGYAIGAISAKAGGNFDGTSITFMKIGDGKLDPKDSYESDYVGTDEKKPPVKISGEGKPVVGIVGKTRDKDMTAFGLVFKGQEKYVPKKKK